MGWENKKNWRYGHTNNFQIGLRYKPGGFFWRSPCSSLSIFTLLLSFMWEINDDDEKKNCKRPLQKKSHPRLVSRKWHIIRKKKFTSHPEKKIPSAWKGYAIQDVKLWQHWANVAKFWICEPNSSCFVQNNLQRIHLWTNQFCLYYDLMFTILINYLNVSKLVNILTSLRVLTRNSEILALQWSCGIKGWVWPKSGTFFCPIASFQKAKWSVFLLSQRS